MTENTFIVPILDKDTHKILGHASEDIDARIAKATSEQKAALTTALSGKLDTSVFTAFTTVMSDSSAPSDTAVAIAANKALIEQEAANRTSELAHLKDSLTQQIASIPKPDLSAYALKSDTATKTDLAAAVTPDALAKTQGYWIVRSDSQPEPTMYGVPVIWIDTANPDKYKPAPPAFTAVGHRYTIPADRGATYWVDGVEAKAGTYTAPEPYPNAIKITAKAKAGFTFAVGATTSWEYTFEAVPIPYEDEILPMSSYWRLDDTPGTKAPRDRGTAPLARYLDLNEYSITFGAPGIGVGATSAKITGINQNWLEFSPSQVRAFTATAVIKWVDGANLALFLMSSQNDAMPALVFGAAGDGRTIFQPKLSNGGGTITEVTNPSTVPQPTNGQVLHIAYTWDGAILTGYVDGIAVVTGKWSGSQVASELLEGWETRGNATGWYLAGVGITLGEAKSSEWVAKASKAVAR